MTKLSQQLKNAAHRVADALSCTRRNRGAVVTPQPAASFAGSTVSVANQQPVYAVIENVVAPESASSVHGSTVSVVNAKLNYVTLEHPAHTGDQADAQTIRSFHSLHSLNTVDEASTVVGKQQDAQSVTKSVTKSIASSTHSARSSKSVDKMSSVVSKQATTEQANTEKANVVKTDAQSIVSSHHSIRSAKSVTKMSSVVGQPVQAILPGAIDDAANVVEADPASKARIDYLNKAMAQGKVKLEKGRVAYNLACKYTKVKESYKPFQTRFENIPEDKELVLAPTSDTARAASITSGKPSQFGTENWTDRTTSVSGGTQKPSQFGTNNWTDRTTSVSGASKKDASKSSVSEAVEGAKERNYQDILEFATNAGITVPAGANIEEISALIQAKALADINKEVDMRAWADEKAASFIAKNGLTDPREPSLKSVSNPSIEKWLGESPTPSAVRSSKADLAALDQAPVRTRQKAQSDYAGKDFDGKPDVGSGEDTKRGLKGDKVTTPLTKIETNIVERKIEAQANKAATIAIIKEELLQPVSKPTSMVSNYIGADAGTGQVTQYGLLGKKIDDPVEESIKDFIMQVGRPLKDTAIVTKSSSSVASKASTPVAPKTPSPTPKAPSPVAPKTPSPVPKAPSPVARQIVESTQTSLSPIPEAAPSVVTGVTDHSIGKSVALSGLSVASTSTDNSLIRNLATPSIVTVTSDMPEEVQRAFLLLEQEKLKAQIKVFTLANEQAAIEAKKAAKTASKPASAASSNKSVHSKAASAAVTSVKEEVLTPLKSNSAVNVIAQPITDAEVQAALDGSISKMTGISFSATQTDELTLKPLAKPAKFREVNLDMTDEIFVMPASKYTDNMTSLPKAPSIDNSSIVSA